MVFLTGFGSTQNETLALTAGALDFVDKSRGVPVLVARLRRIMETGSPVSKSDEFLHRGLLVLKPRTSRAYWNNVDLDLTVTVFKVVKLLATTVGEFVIYRRVYDCIKNSGFIAGYGDQGYRTNVRSMIKRIRNKFRAIDGTFTAIENFPSFGYRWTDLTYPVHECGQG